MANNFTNDTNCVALYRLENGALTADSIGTNTLTNNNSVSSETGDYQEGSGCADFELDSSQYFTIADADLDSGFPIKSGSSETAISVCMWVKFESVTAWHNLFSKFDPGANQKTFCINVDTTPAIRLNIGYSGGTSHETYTHGSTLTTGRWYHVGVTYDFTSKDYLIRIWDDTAGSIVGTDLDSTGTNSISITSSTLAIGARESAGDNYHDGLLDEIVVFKDILSPDEIDKIRQGIYGYQAFHVSDGEGGYEAFNVSDGGYEAFNVSGLETSLTAEAGSYTILGQSVNLLRALEVNAGLGSFAITGQDADLIYTGSYSIVADSGTFAISGQIASLLYDRLFTNIDSGSYTLTGQAVSLSFGRSITIGSGSYTLTGQDVNLTYAGIYSLSVSAGSFAITGQNVLLVWTRTSFSVGSGTFSIAGSSVLFTKSSDFFNSEFIAQLEAETATVVICIALTIDETTYYWCDGTIPIYLDSNKYLPKGINLDSIEAETGMSMKRCQISVPNADGIIGSLVMSEDVREEQFILYWAALNDVGEIVASGNGYGEFFRGVIDDWDNDYSKDTVILRGVDELIYWQAKTLLTSDATCPWPFKGARCGYSGSATYCDQTYELCKTYGNTNNFGGDLYLPEIMEKQLWWGKGKV